MWIVSEDKSLGAWYLLDVYQFQQSLWPVLSVSFLALVLSFMADSKDVVPSIQKHMGTTASPT